VVYMQQHHLFTSAACLVRTSTRKPMRGAQQCPNHNITVQWAQNAFVEQYECTSVTATLQPDA